AAPDLAQVRIDILDTNGGLITDPHQIRIDVEPRGLDNPRADGTVRTGTGTPGATRTTISRDGLVRDLFYGAGEVSGTVRLRITDVTAVPNASAFVEVFLLASRANPTITVTADGPYLAAGGGGFSTISAAVIDAFGNSLEGELVSFALDDGPAGRGGTFLPSGALTAQAVVAGGKAQVVYQAGPLEGFEIVRAKLISDPTAVGTGQIGLHGPAAALQVTGRPPLRRIVGDLDPISITFTAKDANDIPVPGHRITTELLPTGRISGRLLEGAVRTGKDGTVATSYVAGTRATPPGLPVRIGGRDFAGHATPIPVEIILDAGPPAALEISEIDRDNEIQACPPGEPFYDTTIVVTVLDAFTNPVPNARVQIFMGDGRCIPGDTSISATSAVVSLAEGVFNQLTLPAIAPTAADGALFLIYRAQPGIARVRAKVRPSTGPALEACVSILTGDPTLFDPLFFLPSNLSEITLVVGDPANPATASVEITGTLASGCSGFGPDGRYKFFLAIFPDEDGDVTGSLETAELEFALAGGIARPIRNAVYRAGTKAGKVTIVTTGSVFPDGTVNPSTFGGAATVMLKPADPARMTLTAAPDRMFVDLKLSATLTPEIVDIFGNKIGGSVAPTFAVFDLPGGGAMLRNIDTGATDLFASRTAAEAALALILDEFFASNLSIQYDVTTALGGAMVTPAGLKASLTQAGTRPVAYASGDTGSAAGLSENLHAVIVGFPGVTADAQVLLITRPPTSLELTALPLNLTGDGQQTSMVTGVFRYADATPAAGVTANWSLDLLNLGTLLGETTASDLFGEIRALVQAGTNLPNNPLDRLLTVTLNDTVGAGLSADAVITLHPVTISLRAEPTALQAGSAKPARMIAFLQGFAGAPVAGVEVQFRVRSGDGHFPGGARQTDVLSDALGIAEVDLLPGLSTGPVVVRALIRRLQPGGEGDATVTLTGFGQTLVLANALPDPATAIANGMDTIRLTVQLIDSAGVGVPNETLALALSNAAAGTVPASISTDAGGFATLELTAGILAGDFSVIVTDPGSPAAPTPTLTVAYTLTAGAPATLEFTPASIQAMVALPATPAPPIIITARLRDTFGNPITTAGWTIRLTPNNATLGTVTPSNPITNAAGEATFSFQPLTIAGSTPITGTLVTTGPAVT
ncbi:MAG: Ig-like domain-containing protein, partial [Planctomycetes bacterium]|nr:Ig-like domain-containing protein [Planctomycetota bacterium]